jgi:hypothetical protein
MKAKRILYYGGYWPTNMGNSFIDLGAKNILARACGEAEVFSTSRFSRYYAQHRQHSTLPFLRNSWKALDITGWAEVDWVVVAGNVTNRELILIEGPMIRSLVKNGARLIILGGGCSTYTEQEADEFRSFMQEVDTHIFISRDQPSFSAYHDCARHSFQGIDSAFFVADAVPPLKLTRSDYVACSFDDQRFEEKLDLQDAEILRTRHYSFGIRERFIKKLNDTLVSDLPYDYLHLYANAKAVYSDRVHACVAALSYGVPARLFSKSPRAYLFAELGVEEITQRLVQLSPEVLERRKLEELAWLSAVLSNG